VIPECGAYPYELDGYVTLADESRLHIRPLQSGEEGPIRELYERLSPTARYRRFFSPLLTLPDSVMNLLVSVDQCRRLALVAEHDGDGGGEVVALASYGALDDECAEVALVVRDDWQNRHVGTTIAGRVLQAAEARGYRRFVAHVLTDNAAARQVLNHVGRIVEATASGGTSELRFVRRA
jgi:RimJ/RimL family protein N-acetyltransferase